MLEKAPNIYELEQVIKSAANTHTVIDEKWVPARPYGYHSWRGRLKAAWMVFSGKADALVWPNGQ